MGKTCFSEWGALTKAQTLLPGCRSQAHFAKGMAAQAQAE